MKNAMRAGLVGSVFLTLVACSQRGPAVGTSRPTAADSVYIQVQNQSFLDATVYTNFAGATRRRLGNVVGQQTRTYALRWTGAEMFFVVDFVGSRRRLSTRTFVFRPGEGVELRIPSNANQTGNLIVTRR